VSRALRFCNAGGFAAVAAAARCSVLCCFCAVCRVIGHSSAPLGDDVAPGALKGLSF
jgi:hypothetical protein